MDRILRIWRYSATTHHAFDIDRSAQLAISSETCYMITATRNECCNGTDDAAPWLARMTVQLVYQRIEKFSLMWTKSEVYRSKCACEEAAFIRYANCCRHLCFPCFCDIISVSPLLLYLIYVLNDFCIILLLFPGTVDGGLLLIFPTLDFYVQWYIYILFFYIVIRVVLFKI